jgi:YesN/AraC family two-component response regulator
MLREAFALNITGFLKKPITAESLSKTFSIALKLIIAQRVIDQEG